MDKTDQMLTSFIYVIGPEDGPYKIGMSRRLKGRLAQLQMGHPDRLTIHHAESVNRQFAARIEGLVHTALADRRRGGEWFAVPFCDAIAALRTAVRVAPLSADDDPNDRWTIRNFPREKRKEIALAARVQGMTTGQWMVRAIKAHLAREESR